MKQASFSLADDPRLLDAMLSDSRKQGPLYRPGPYWQAKAEAASQEIRETGIGDFRGSSTLIGQSYSDALTVDRRQNLRGGIVKPLFRWMTTSVYPLNRVYQNQVNCTRDFAELNLDYIGEILTTKDRVACLLGRYAIPYSLLGGCLSKVKLDGEEVAVHYIDLLDQHDYLTRSIDFRKIRSMFEIGGGFGANVHILLENYQNIRKVLYLDIPPNLYVGTQYLKAFYGDAVIDYGQSRNRQGIQFRHDDAREILCIAPWQIEGVRDEVDIFINSHSFVEMPRPVVQNYADKAINDSGTTKTAIALSSYDRFDPSMTIDPDDLPGFFKSRQDFTRFSEETLLQSSRRNLFYVSPGRY